MKDIEVAGKGYHAVSPSMWCCPDCGDHDCMYSGKHEAFICLSCGEVFMPDYATITTRGQNDIVPEPIPPWIPSRYATYPNSTYTPARLLMPCPDCGSTHVCGEEGSWYCLSCHSCWKYIIESED